MKRALVAASMFIALTAGSTLVTQAFAAEPDYSTWNRILTSYYSPAKGMDYAGLKAHDMAAIQKLRQDLGKVNAASLNRKEQLAYWINVYNVNTTVTVLEGYPVKSIRDLSTDPVIRLNVFKKQRVPTAGGMLSLNDVENGKIREGFKDPRIHFAINCAARSCPPVRTEAYTGDKLDAQLDDQARKFLSGPLGARVQKDGSTLRIHVTKIMDWFGEDFTKWGGGKLSFLRRFVSADKQAMIDAAGGKAALAYDDYDWSLNNWSR